MNTRFPPEELAAIDNWIARQGRQLSRPEAVRRLVGIGIRDEIREEHVQSAVVAAASAKLAIKAAKQTRERELKGKGK
ncbi:hypothetical protein [Bradyrhizobium diazoefficiens]|uniref:hypothetical protein n=1 Tax=Bradyrhizobium diazoefficiens TaxID=1355477 RepID=UPI002729C47B|nr:hypothetical protein [Bradyrhizobium diazoefficiens]WLA62362.1 hypothetical protein QNN01_28265 [Bradyrhizobium diazoefficiens]